MEEDFEFVRESPKEGREVRKFIGETTTIKKVKGCKAVAVAAVAASVFCPGGARNSSTKASEVMSAGWLLRSKKRECMSGLSWVRLRRQHYQSKQTPKGDGGEQETERADGDDV